ncbi:NAD(P)H-hydrate dehydratase, partial [bacterium I07]
FIAGASSYFGAPYFSALSFLHAGGGYSRLAAPRSVTPAIAAMGNEIVFAPQDETSEGSLASNARVPILEIANKADMVVMGPGLSLNNETQDLIRSLSVSIKKPLLIDGDGFTAICADPDSVSKRSAPTILTPHLGEMARLVKKPVHEVSQQAVALATEQAAVLNAVIVLKGAHSIIAFPDGEIHINLSGCSGMATAGSGDVLTGTIAAMHGLGLNLKQAVLAGVFIHGFSGDLAAVQKGEDGMTAKDILDTLPCAVKSYREQYQDILKDCYRTIHQL